MSPLIFTFLIHLRVHMEMSRYLFYAYGALGWKMLTACLAYLGIIYSKKVALKLELCKM